MKYKYELEFETKNDNILEILSVITKAIVNNLMYEATNIKPKITLLEKEEN